MVVILRGAPPPRRDVPKFDYSDPQAFLRRELSMYGYEVLTAEQLRRRDARKNDKRALLLSYKNDIGSAHMSAFVLWPRIDGRLEIQHFEDPHVPLPEEIIEHVHKMGIVLNLRPINYHATLHAGKFRKPQGKRRKNKIRFSDWIKDEEISKLRRLGKLRE